MERDPFTPLIPAESVTTPEAPPRLERGSFFEKLRKKAKRSPEVVLTKKPEVTEAPAQPESSPQAESPQPERRNFGKNILDLSRMESPAEAPPTPAERIDDHLRGLEQSAEASKTATLATAGLGVIAVLVTGTGYFGNKRREREVRRNMKEQFKLQEKAVGQQRQEFNQLRETQAAAMDRAPRQQTEYNPEALELSPLVRVETADTIERAPGQQTGSAGTGFFGGGGGGIAHGTGLTDLKAPELEIDPNSREARQLEVLRKVEQTRLRRNAWLYSGALVVAMITFAVVAIVLG